MRIAYVLDQRLPSRSTDTEQALNTIDAMMAAGAEVTLWLPRHAFAPDASAEALRDYYQVEAPFTLRRVRSLFPAPRAIEKAAHAARAALDPRLRASRDLVYTRNISGAVAALLAGHRVAYETYRPWPDQHRALGPLFRWLIGHRRFVGAVLHSDYARQHYLTAGVDPARLAVVYNGYAPERFEPPLSRAEARAQLGLDPARPIVTYTGRVTMHKGLDVVLEAAARLPHVRFLIVGSEDPQGEVEQRARHLENVQVEPWATFDALVPYLHASDALVIPPSLQPLEQVGNTVLPMKLFLYLAAGRPILAPIAPDTAELLSHDDNAWLVTPGDIDACVRGLETLTSDAARAERLGARARAMARDLTWTARGQRIVSLLEGWLARP